MAARRSVPAGGSMTMRAVAVYAVHSEAGRYRQRHCDAHAHRDPSPVRLQVTYVTICVERLAHRRIS